MLSQAESKLVVALEDLSKYLVAGRLRDRKKIDRQIGAVLARHPRSARYYEVNAEKVCDRYALKTARKDDLYEQAEALTGCYVLRTNTTGPSSEELWHLYMTLTTAEAGFKAMKSTLGLRPVFHPEGHCEAQILIAVLAKNQLQRFIT